MRLLFRLIGLLLFIAGLAFLVRDLFHRFMDGAWQPLTLGELWLAIDSGGLAATQRLIQGSPLPALWDPAMVWLLLQPVFAVTLVPGLLLVALTRRRRESRRGMY